MIQANWSCLRLFRQTMAWALAFARDSAGRRSAAKMAMMAITTNNSIKVKPLFDPLLTLPSRRRAEAALWRAAKAERGTERGARGTRLDIAFNTIPRVNIKVSRPTSSPQRRACLHQSEVPEGGGAFCESLPDVAPVR